MVEVPIGSIPRTADVPINPAATPLTVPSLPPATTIGARAATVRAASAKSCPRSSIVIRALEPAARKSSAMSATECGLPAPTAAAFKSTMISFRFLSRALP
jgi:hypothetical protein